MSYFSGRDILWTIWCHNTWLGSIDLNKNRTKHNARNMTKHSLNWLKGVRWLTKVDRFRDKLKTQLFRYANANRCHVQRWTVKCCHINKWKTFHFPLISPPRKVSTSFCFLTPKRVTNTCWSSSSVESILIFFMNLRKEGFVPKQGLSSCSFTSPKRLTNTC